MLLRNRKENSCNALLQHFNQNCNRTASTARRVSLLVGALLVSSMFAHAQHFSVSDLGSLNRGGVIDVS